MRQALRGATLLTKASTARGEAAARRSDLNARHDMPPKAAASNDLDMVKALTDRLEELDATAAESQVMVDEGEKELREAARNAPLGPLTLCQMRALDRGDGVRTPPTGSDQNLTLTERSLISSSLRTGAPGRHLGSRHLVAHSVSCHATSTCVDRQCCPCFSSKFLARVDQTPLYSQYTEFGVISFN